MVETEIDKLILKATSKYKGLKITKTSFQKKNKVGRLTLCYIRTYHKVTSIKIVCQQHKD